MDICLIRIDPIFQPDDLVVSKALGSEADNYAKIIQKNLTVFVFGIKKIRIRSNIIGYTDKGDLVSYRTAFDLYIIIKLSLFYYIFAKNQYTDL